jgi:hypothetical protein
MKKIISYKSISSGTLNLECTFEANFPTFYVNIQQDTKKHYKRADPGSKYKKMAENTKRSDYYRIFFPSVERRLAVNLHLNPNVTTIMSEHGNIRSYLYLLTYSMEQSPS